MRMAKVKESIEDLERQKEDIENLLASLEAGYKEGSVPEEHYNEVKQKNTEKLDEIKGKIAIVEKQVEKESQKLAKQDAAKEELAPEEPPAEDSGKKKPKQKEPKAEEPPPEPAEPQKAVEKKEEKPGVFGELAAKFSKEKEEANDERIKEKIIMELAPKIEKINLRLVKLKAYVDTFKEDKTSERESSQRITEEVGETRSAMNAMEGRVGEIEMKVEDVSETLADLKPQKFTKDLQKKEEELKMHEARLEKLDDMNSTILKRVNQTQILLEKLGNIEAIAEMTKELSKKLMSIDERDKKITRLADKIDSMFVEMNKRLEEFMFYKAKQDSLDDLSKEMLKSIDELGTKLMRYAEKDDLELLRDTLESKMNTMNREAAAAVPPTQMQQTQQGRSEIESLMKLLDEQFKKGQMSKKDYEKAKEANMQKLRQMAVESMMPSQPASMMEQKPPAEEAPPSAEPASGENPAPAEAEPEGPEEAEQPKEETPESGLAAAAKISRPEPTISASPEKETVSKKPKEPAKTEKAKAPSPEEPVIDARERSAPEEPRILKEKPEKRRAPEAEPEPEKTISKDEVARKIASAKPVDKKQKMLSDLEYSFRQGMISQKAYETTQRIIMSKKF